MTPEEIAKSIALYDETQGNETQKSISQNTDWTTKIGERGIEVVCLVLDAKKSSKTQAGSTELEIFINDLDDVDVDPVVGEKTDDGILLNVKHTTLITEEMRKINPDSYHEKQEWDRQYSGRKELLSAGTSVRILVRNQSNSPNNSNVARSLKPLDFICVSGLRAVTYYPENYAIQGAKNDKQKTAEEKEKIIQKALQDMIDLKRSPENAPLAWNFNTISKYPTNLTTYEKLLQATPRGFSPVYALDVATPLPHEIKEVNQEIFNGDTRKMKQSRTIAWNNKMSEEVRKFVNSTHVLEVCKKGVNIYDPNIADEGKRQTHVNFYQFCMIPEPKDEEQAAKNKCLLKGDVTGFQWSKKLLKNTSISNQQPFTITFTIYEKHATQIFPIKNLELFKKVAPHHIKNFPFIMLAWIEKDAAFDQHSTLTRELREKDVKRTSFVPKSVSSKFDEYLISNNSKAFKVTKEYVYEKFARKMGNDNEGEPYVTEDGIRFNDYNKERVVNFDSQKLIDSKVVSSLFPGVKNISELDDETYIVNTKSKEYYTLTNIDFDKCPNFDSVYNTIPEEQRAEKISAVLLGDDPQLAEELGLTDLDQVEECMFEFSKLKADKLRKKIKDIQDEEIQKLRELKAKTELSNDDDNDDNDDNDVMTDVETDVENDEGEIETRNVRMTRLQKRKRLREKAEAEKKQRPNE